MYSHEILTGMKIEDTREVCPHCSLWIEDCSCEEQGATKEEREDIKKRREEKLLENHYKKEEEISNILEKIWLIFRDWAAYLQLSEDERIKLTGEEKLQLIDAIAELYKYKSMHGQKRLIK